MNSFQQFFKCLANIYNTHSEDKLMLGKNYFSNRLGDIYEYSRIHYKCGDGEGIFNNNPAKYYWELCVDVSGNIIFVLHPKNNYIPLDNFRINSFSGKSNDETWNINCTDIRIVKQSVKVNENHSLFCIPSTVILTRKTQSANTPNQAKVYLSNFDFVGLDDKQGFFVKINSTKSIYFQLLENKKEISELIEIKRIDNAILSTFDIPINDDETIDEIELEIESISWFLSFLTMNLNATPIIEYYSDNQIVKYFIKNEYKTTYKSSYIIDNFYIDRGIPRAFNTSYQDYKISQNQLNINIFINFLLEIHQQPHIELQIAIMLMAYKYILSKYLLAQGILINDMNLQQKLKQLNSIMIMRFIPSNLMSDDTLRASIRNPLFHQGEIPLLSLDKKIDFYKKYYDLLIRITLRILNYSHEYISRETQSPSPKTP